MNTIASTTTAENAIVRAEQLARQIDELLVAAAHAEAKTEMGCPFTIRLAQGLTRSLVDQLAELRPSVRDRLASTRPSDEMKTRVA